MTVRCGKRGSVIHKIVQIRHVGHGMPVEWLAACSVENGLVTRVTAVSSAKQDRANRF
jgi:hypothetical protein